MTRAEVHRFLSENPWIQYVPNTLTIGNTLCGFSAVLYTLFAYDAQSEVTSTSVFGIAAGIILFATLFDTLDGFAARVFNAASIRGMEMDSLSDMVSFGVAPATLVAVMVHRLRDQAEIHYSLVWLFCAMYIATVALRLSQYNTSVIQGKKFGPLFKGLPCPGAAAGICSLVFLYVSNTVALYNALRLLPPYCAVVSLLMVSPFHYTHMGRWLCTLRRSRRRMSMALAAILLLVIWPVYTFFAMVNLYILSGPAYALYLYLNRKKKVGQRCLDGSNL